MRYVEMFLVKSCCVSILIPAAHAIEPSTGFAILVEIVFTAVWYAIEYRLDRIRDERS